MIDMYASIYGSVTTEFVRLLAGRDYTNCSLHSRILLPSLPTQFHCGREVLRWIYFRLLIPFSVISLNKPLIVPNEKAGYFFSV